jgi:hypothetical protein
VRNVPTFVSVAVLVWAVAATLRVPGRELTWAVPAYVIAQCIFALIGLWGLQRTDEQHASYAIFFNVGFFIVLLAAFIATGRFLAVFPPVLAVFVMVGCICFSAVTAGIAYYELLRMYNDHIPATLISTIWQAAILLVCGSASILSVFAESRPALQISASALGTFWFLLGAFFFAYCVGIVRLHSSFLRLNHYVPMMLAIVAFGYLALELGKLQSEVAREAVPAVEIQVAR